MYIIIIIIVIMIIILILIIILSIYTLSDLIGLLSLANEHYHSMQFFSFLPLTDSPPRDLQITAYK